MERLYDYDYCLSLSKDVNITVIVALNFAIIKHFINIQKEL